MNKAKLGSDSGCPIDKCAAAKWKDASSFGPLLIQPAKGPK